MVAVSRYLPGETIPVVTADANAYNGQLVEFDGNVDSSTGYPTVVIGTADSTDIAGVVDCGRVEGQKGTSSSKYASGVPITVRRSGVVVLTDAGTGGSAGDYVNAAASGDASANSTFDASANIGRLLNAATAGGDMYVELNLR